MFYFNELKFRLNYLLISFLSTMGVSYQYSDVLLFSLMYNVTALSLAQVFSYSNPTLLLDFFITITFYFSSFFFFYQALYQLIDFLKPGLKLFEYHFLSKVLSINFTIFLCFNLNLCFTFFPCFWISSTMFITASDLLFFELTLVEYFANLKLTMFGANLCFFMIFLFHSSVIFLEVQTCFFLYRFYLLLNMLILFLVVPSISSLQIYTFVLLIFFLEFVFLLKITNHKISKHLKMLSRHYVK
jgi:hypothetical protein